MKRLGRSAIKGAWVTLLAVCLSLGGVSGFAADEPAPDGNAEGQGDGAIQPPDLSDETPVKEIDVTEGRISLDLRNIEVSEALRFLATRGKLNLVISKTVAGRIFLVLNNVPVMDAFDIILLSNALAYDKQGEIYQIMTDQEYKTKYGRDFSDPRTVRIYRLQYALPERVFAAVEALKSEIGRVLVDQESGTVFVMDTAEKIAEIDKVVDILEQKRIVRAFPLQYAKVKDIEDRLKAQLDSKGVGTVQSDERTNQLIVQTYPERLKQIEELIASLDKKTKEVLIVSKIIRVTLADDFHAEIKWEGMFQGLLRDGSFIGNHELDPVNRGLIGQSYLDDYYKVDIDKTERMIAGPKSTLLENLVIGQKLDDKTFETLINFLRTIGETRVLASPRIMVVNNQEAKIHVGERQAYITSTTTTGSSTATTAEEVNFIDVGIELAVTPTINDNGYVSMKIKPVISTVKEFLQTASGNKIPIVDTSEAETSVMVKDGTTIVIAGLRRDEWQINDDQVPFLGDVPILGRLFKSNSKSKRRTEVLVILTPTITGGEKFDMGEPTSLDYDMKSYREYSDLKLEGEKPEAVPPGQPGFFNRVLKKMHVPAHD
ncbi:MAG: secretin N-terminal domain-containing protein [Candidatus Omnitrophota bacterium]|jgi:type II secretory pathway component GspD/PulD (secretin)